MPASSTEAIRLITPQSGRSFRLWKIVGWVTLSMINMNIAELKGRGKYRWGCVSLFTGPFTTMFLTFTGPQFEHPESKVPQTASKMYTVPDQPLNTETPSIEAPTTSTESPEISTPPPQLESKKSPKEVDQEASSK